MVKGVSSAWNGATGEAICYEEKYGKWRVQVDRDGMLVEAWLNRENMHVSGLDRAENTFTVNVSSLGISGGMLSCYHESNDGTLCMQYFMGLLLALQCFALQGAILYYVYVYVEAKSREKGDQSDAPWPLMVVAIYLHLHNIMASIPAGGSAVRKAFTDRAWVALSVIFIDSIIMPFATIFMGAMFLCTSGGVDDLLLNSCAVAFVTYIDDWIVQSLYAWTNHLGEEEEVDLPRHSPTYIRVVMWSAFFVPIVPAALCVGMAYYGVEVLEL